MAKTRWKIITVKNISPNNIKTGIELKLPAHIQRCKAVGFAASTYAPDSKGNVLGRAVLSFGNKKVYPVNLEVRFKNPADLKKKIEFFPLDEKNCGGKSVQGFFQDFGNGAVYPYDLKIYLECETK